MQSCDICRKRKVKCDRRTPCARCTRLRQPCTYTDILRKKGPKFLHSYPSIYTSTPTSTSTGTLASASVSNETLPQLPRAVDTEVDIEHLLDRNLEVQRFDSGSGTGTASELDEEFEVDLDLDFGDAPPPQQQLHQDLILGPELAPGSRGCIDMENILSLYVETLYPLFPVVYVQEIRLGSRFGYGYGPTRYSLLCSICAAGYAHLASRYSDHESELGHEHERACEQYLYDALQTRGQRDASGHHRGHQNRQDGRYDGERDEILCSFFSFLAYWYLRRERHAWWYLRECIALLLSSQLHREDEYRKLEVREAEARRVVFWGVFAAERAFCLLHDKPITLRPWIDLPRLPSVLNEGIIPGFVRLVTLYRDLSVDLSGCWTAAGFVTPVTFSYATPEAHGHDINHDTELPLVIQRLDTAVTREWLRAKAWRLGIPGSQQRPSCEFVASKENPHWRLEEPLSIGRAILGILQGFSAFLQGCWSVILDQKLYDICECLCDMQPVIQTRPDGEADLKNIFRGLLELMSGLGGRSAYLVVAALGKFSE
ncbi:uncharacterized protein BDV17DRAFT_301540 [Aspergillus undulatus]|uniref:uncharacterized protein n=1 Tax=Aspergillus undulatus TaxID=1810928 RepID=UPI003CCD123D